LKKHEAEIRKIYNADAIATKVSAIIVSSLGVITKRTYNEMNQPINEGEDEKKTLCKLYCTRTSAAAIKGSNKIYINASEEYLMQNRTVMLDLEGIENQEDAIEHNTNISPKRN
jgi:hypothetical protein